MPNKLESYKFLNKRPTFRRLDTAPSLIFYVIYFAIVSAEIVVDPIFKQVLLIAIFLLHAFIFLLNFWSNKARALISFSKAKNIQSADHVQVETTSLKKHLVRQYIVELQKVDEGNGVEYYIEFNKVRKIYDENKKTFVKIAYVINESFEYYKKNQGYKQQEDINKARQKWGINDFDMPEPSFSDLMKEHVVAPFFVFQLFCTALWLLDEYWYYAMFTLVMLLVFESTVVASRKMNMKKLHNARLKADNILAYRQGKWQEIKTTELLPKDMVKLKIKKGNKEQTVPCDLLLLSGSCVVNEAILTGESVPQIKENIIARKDETFDIKGSHKVHVLFGGTQILMISAEDSSGNQQKSGSSAEVACYVLRTGFETSQGKLMRKILATTDRVTVESKEAYFYLLILLSLAIAAASYVFYYGIQDPKRDTYKLILRCILILTSVVPPELPVQLSLAVNFSLKELMRQSIYCTEPFRIPDAGKVDVCCFDKTGTLTRSELIVKGLSINDNEIIELKDLGIPHRDALFVLGGCHSIINMGNAYVGDPIETVTLQQTKWRFNKDTETAAYESKEFTVTMAIKRRFLFDSSVKRMSCVARINFEAKGSSMYRLLCKGAPEVIKDLIKDLPANYESTMNYHVRNGARVLALAYKDLGATFSVADISRTDLEKDLIFCGFLISKCPLKVGTAKSILNLKKTGHDVVMITGDNPLTAIHTAREANIGTNDPVLCKVVETSQSNYIEVIWEDFDQHHISNLSLAKDLDRFRQEKMLCMTGSVLQQLIDMYGDKRQLSELITKVSVFARVDPSHKEFIVRCFNTNGHTTVMVGDGTNDVGALKTAHVGIALLNNPEVAIQAPKIQKPDEMYNDQVVAELGDACMAAPFTYKFASLNVVFQVLSQGRCTLVTTFQMYKILALNSLLSAYTMSVLTLDGVRSGDYQNTIIGMAIGFLFLFMSFSQPLKNLSKRKPPVSIFGSSLLLSVFGQFAIHFIVLYIIMGMVQPYSPSNQINFDPDSPFEPNVKNSVVFLYTTIVISMIFLSNYQGRPFMQSIKKNRKFLYICLALLILGLLGSVDEFEEIRDLLQLSPIPREDNFREKMVGLFALDVIGSLAIEKTINFIYYGNKDD